MDAKELSRFVSSELAKLANPKNAGPMQAYMKTTMAFYGVKKPDRAPVVREMHKRFTPATQKEYEAGVLGLWRLEHREEKYLALQFAERHKAFVGPASLDLYERLIREGQWWDLVDEVSVQLVGRVLLKHRVDVKGRLYAWSKDEDMWVRRASIIMHTQHKADTDERELFRVCKALAHEKVFWIRKAIGWALRDYAKVKPSAVRAFVDENRDILSGLSLREAERGIASAPRGRPSSRSAPTAAR